jgi:hypothetical protein
MALEKKKNEDYLKEIEKLQNINLKLTSELKLKENSLSNDSELQFEQFNIPPYEKKQKNREILQEILSKSKDIISIAVQMDDHLVKRQIPFKKSSQLFDFYYKRLNFNQNLKEFRFSNLKLT